MYEENYYSCTYTYTHTYKEYNNIRKINNIRCNKVHSVKCTEIHV